MATKVIAPLLGEGVDELTIVKWLKKEGDPIQEMESLLEVETDKVVTEIPSPASGVLLKILVPENSPVSVGKNMAWIGEKGEEPGENGLGKTTTNSSKKLSKDTSKKHQKPMELPMTQVKEKKTTNESGFLSPIVRKLAAEHNLDLSNIQGTGLNGRITKGDVLAFVAGMDISRKPVTTLPTGGTIPLTSIRRQIAERMQRSKQVTPHVLTVMEVDISRVVANREEKKKVFLAEGVNLTYTAYLLMALADALKTYPLVNSSWTEQGIYINPEINIGMATSLGEEGLIVPVIRDADKLSLIEIARMANDLAQRARTHGLKPEEVRNGTFTLTNHGIGGSLFAMPIINQPQCGILGTGSIQKRAVVITDGEGNDSIAIRPMIYLSLVFDHRILDGAIADLFLSCMKDTLEKWE